MLFRSFDREAEICARCERAFMEYLSGGCSIPAGVYARILDKERMKVQGLYYNEASKRSRRMCITGDRRRPEALGRELARQLKEGRESLG